MPKLGMPLPKLWIPPLVLRIPPLVLRIPPHTLGMPPLKLGMSYQAEPAGATLAAQLHLVPPRAWGGLVAAPKGQRGRCLMPGSVQAGLLPRLGHCKTLLDLEHTADVRRTLSSITHYLMQAMHGYEYDDAMML